MGETLAFWVLWVVLGLALVAARVQRKVKGV